MSLDHFQVMPGVTHIGGKNAVDGTAPILGFGRYLQFGKKGALAMQQTPESGTVPTIANGGTITPNDYGISVVTTGGAVTGAIVAVGTYPGQMLVIVNNSANTITMAAVGTSNVAAGVAAIVPATGALLLVWNPLDSKWYDVG